MSASVLVGAPGGQDQKYIDQRSDREVDSRLVRSNAGEMRHYDAANPVCTLEGLAVSVGAVMTHRLRVIHWERAQHDPFA